MKNKKGFQFSFSWIFAIFIGAVIIFLAIFFAAQLVDTKRLEEGTITGRQLGILLNPIETNLEDIKYTPITIKKPTRIFNGCKLANPSNIFGSQEISASVSSGLGQKWIPDPGVTSSFHNKYLFSKNMSEGEKNFFVFSKPFYFPFKIADIIILWTDNEKYCFNNPPLEIANDIESLELNNIKLSNCNEEDIEICFSGSCDIEVSETSIGGTVTKNNIVYHFIKSEDSNNRYPLLYAAIFSDIDNYECQLQRLFARADKLTELYKSKREFLDERECRMGNKIETDLNILQRAIIENINSVSNSGNIQLDQQLLSNAKSASIQLNDDNRKLNCKLF